jgi:hypothetical protein
MGMGGILFSGAIFPIKAAFSFKNKCGIPQTGDAGVKEQVYLNVNLGDRETGSGCSLRPTRHSERTPLIPISDHGNGRHNFFCGRFFQK